MAKVVEIYENKVINCDNGAVRAVRYNVNGYYCLTSGSDKKIRLWNPKTGLLLKTYSGHADEVTDAVGSEDSSHIISSSLDKSIIYWDVTSAQTLRRLRVHAGAVTCVRFNEESRIAVSGSKDNTIMCWDVRERRNEPIQTMRDAKDCITSIIVTDYKIIASSLDGCIRQYDVRSGQLICDRSNRPVTYIAITKDKQCILAACSDGILRLIDIDSGKLLSEYTGHKAEDFQIECGIMSNDSQIVSGSSEGCAVIWDLLDGKEVLRIKLGPGVVHSLTTHPNLPDIIFAKKGQLFVYGSNNLEKEEIINR